MSAPVISTADRAVWGREDESPGTSWQSDPGPLAGVGAGLSWSGWETRPRPLRLSAWISSPWKDGVPLDPHVDH